MIDILQEHEILTFISVPAGTALKGDKTNDDIDKNGTKIHIVSQLDPCT